MYAHQLIDFLTKLEAEKKELIDAKEKLAIFEAQLNAVKKLKRELAPKKPTIQQFDKILLDVKRNLQDSAEIKNLSCELDGFLNKYCPDRKVVIDILKNSQHFFLGEVFDFENIVSDNLAAQSRLFANVYSKNELRLPYSDVCLHFSNEKQDIQDNVNRYHKLVLLFRVKSKNSIVSYLAKQIELNHGKKFWTIQMEEYSFFEKNGSVYVNEPANPLGSVNVLEVFMMLLDTKNIHVLENHPPQKLNKKRIKNGKEPLYKYQTLVVQVPGGDKKRKWGGGGNNFVGIHLCRGHFKTYTEKNPLLGQHVGRYWWQPQARGNKNHGVIMKDYSVKIKEASQP